MKSILSLTLTLILTSAVQGQKTGEPMLLTVSLYEDLKDEGCIVSYKNGEETKFGFVEGAQPNFKKGAVEALYLKSKNLTKSYTRKYTKYPDLSYMLPSGSVGGSSAAAVSAALARQMNEVNRINRLRKSLGREASEDLEIKVFERLNTEEINNFKNEEKAKLDAIRARNDKSMQAYSSTLNELNSFHLYAIDRGKKRKMHKYKVRIVSVWHPTMPPPTDMSELKDNEQILDNLDILLEDTKGNYLRLNLRNKGPAQNFSSAFSNGQLKKFDTIIMQPYKTTAKSVLRAYSRVLDIYLENKFIYDPEAAIEFLNR